MRIQSRKSLKCEKRKQKYGTCKIKIIVKEMLRCGLGGRLYVVRVRRSGLGRDDLGNWELERSRASRPTGRQRRRAGRSEQQGGRAGVANPVTRVSNRYAEVYIASTSTLPT